jgi:UDP-4-amino-4,6-dideoxy-N-acetyl-beta-L-altrosamine N-acetyltransferase
MGFTLREIRENDLENIMRWRMDADITRYMNTNPKLTLEGQKKWFEAISADSDVFYRLIEVDGVPSGVINLTKLNAEDGNIGWAYYVGEKKQRSMKLALALEMNMYDYVFDTLGKNAVYSDVFTLNQGVIALHKLCGCEVVEEKKAHVCKEGIYYDVTFMRMTADNWKNIRPSKKYEKITFI